jgi:uncharacterized protein YkwD
MTRTPRTLVRFRAVGLLAGGLLASMLVIAPATSASAASSHVPAKKAAKATSHHKARKARTRHKTTTHKATPAPAGNVTQAAVPVAPANAALEDQVFTIVNQERVKNGCRVLRNDDRLRTAARAQSLDMVTYNYFSHTGHDGSSFVDRQKRAGYTAAGGENIAWGFGTAKDVMVAWMNSTGHRANILNCAYLATGVGVARKSDGTVYWTQEFGRA